MATHRGAAFGLPPTAPPSDDGHGFRSFEDNLWSELGDDALEAFLTWRFSVLYLLREILPHLSNEAEGMIVTAALNDVLALTRHLGARDGRSAAHAARSLFEHRINLLDIQNSAVNDSDRFVSQRHVEADRLQRHRWYLRLLPPNDRRSEARMLDRVRNRHEQAAERAIARYGRGFRSGWAEGSLRDRASQYGLLDEYEGYRILSGVIHGSSGSLAGVIREIRGSQVHRVGTDLDLAIFAFVEGMRSFLGFAEVLCSSPGGAAAEEARDDTEALLGCLPVIRQKLRADDAKLWPRTPPPQLVSIAAAYPDGTVRWFLHDVVDQVIVQALPPDEEPASLDYVRGSARNYDPEFYGGRPKTTRFTNVTLRRKPGARVYPAESILIPAGHPGRLEAPQRVRLRPSAD